MSAPSSAPTTDNARMARRASLASFLGTAFEYLDFSMYAIVAAVVFNKVFFPQSDPVAASIGSVTTFAIGYLARPVGALVLGPLGDRIGRQKITLLTMLGMGGATFLIGCLPSYDTIGYAAPVLLVMLRLAQGFFASGEQAGTGSLTMEHAPSARRAFYISWIQTGVGVGAAIGQLAFIPIFAIPEPALLSWGWRIPFLLSAVWTGVVVLTRRNLRDSVAFVEAKQTGRVARFPLKSLIRHNWRNLVRVMLSVLANVPATVVGVYVFGYAVNTEHVPASQMLTMSLIVLITATSLLPFWAALSDKIGRRPVFAGGTIIGGLLLFPMFFVVGTGNIFFIGIMNFLVYAFLNAGAAISLAIYTEMFPTEVRYSGVATGTQFGTLASGFAPTICYAIANEGPNGWLPVAIFAGGACIVASVAVLSSKETRGVSVEHIDAAPEPEQSQRARTLTDAIDDHGRDIKWRTP